MMRDSGEPDWQALTAFLLSEQSEKQNADIRSWVDESPDHVVLLGTLRSAIQGGPRSSAMERARTWAAIQDRIVQPSRFERAAGTTERGTTGAIRTVSSWSHRVSWAAAVGIAATVAVALTVVLCGPRAVNVEQGSAPVREVITQSGRNAIVRLPDGSTVVLGVGSRLRYATTFDRSERDVYLDGEAFFTVTHANGWPFVVHAGDISARVLGTRFSVRRYASDTVARVVVAQGRVTVRRAVLKAGDAIMAWPGGASTITHGVNVKQELAWTDGGLRFRETPLSVAIPKLERSFGIVVSVDDSTLLAEPITVSLESESPRDALQIVAAITHTHAVWVHDHVVLSRP